MPRFCSKAAGLAHHWERLLLTPAQVLYYNLSKIYRARQQAQQAAAAAAAALLRMSRAPSAEGLTLVERHAGTDRI